MIGSWLTTRAVYVFGALLILIGLIFIGNGVPVVRMEIGPAEIIGGAVAASAGCIVVVLGLFLARMEMLQATLDRVAVATPAVVPRAEEAPFAVAREREPATVRAEPPRYPVVHPLAPAARREWAAPSRAEVQPEPALAIASSDPETDEVLPVDPPEAPVLTESAPALVHAEEEASHSPAVEPFEPVEPVRTRPNFMSSMLARRLMTGSLRRPAEPDPAPLEPALSPLGGNLAAPPMRRSAIDLSSGWDDEPGEPAPPVEAVHVEPAPSEPQHPEPAPSEAMHPEPEPLQAEPVAEPSPPPVQPVPVHSAAATEEPLAPEPAVTIAPVADAQPASPAATPRADQPVVVGRYNAGAASYVMYSNGMIEVETEQGTHQFASMQELKAFIERRDTASAY